MIHIQLHHNKKTSNLCEVTIALMSSKNPPRANYDTKYNAKKLKLITNKAGYCLPWGYKAVAV